MVDTFRLRRDAGERFGGGASANHDLMLEFMNAKNGGEWASVPVAVFYSREFRELHRYIEYPAIYERTESGATSRRPVPARAPTRRGTAGCGSSPRCRLRPSSTCGPPRSSTRY